MQSIHQILKQYWGYSSFRQPQEEIINSILCGKDTLALLPTGGGKSVCFQVPAMAMDGLCLVVSPLIALMKDQVMNLNKRGIKAAAVYTGMGYRQMDTLLDNCVYGDYKFLYVSPERLATDDFRVRMKKMRVCLLAVDEAHCISQWGYDFRPPYLKIAEVRENLKNVPVIALTATATLKVVDDIQQQLLFKQPNAIRKSFVRHNLSYVVRQAPDKQQALADILSKISGSAVVYVRSRRKSKEYADYLNKHGVKAGYYHAGLSPHERSQRQDDWTNNKQRVIVSTNAFGMGIDKPDVRAVVHIDLADSLEAYFQEAGRAGRDEKKAYAVQLLDSSDIAALEKKIEEGFPAIEFVKQVYDALGSYLQLAAGSGTGEQDSFGFDFDISDFSARYKWNPNRVLGAFKILQAQQQLYLTDSIYHPSQVKASATKDVLYKFQVENKALEPMVKFVLRSSEGVFEDYVPINEEALATRLKIPIDEAIKQLTALDRLGIFSYKKRTDKPKVIYLQPRAKNDSLLLDVKAINLRKTEYEQRLKAVKFYVTENNFCRTRLLVKYFGEELETDCGICDVCIAKKKAGLSSNDFAAISRQVESLLKDTPLQPMEIANKLQLNENDLNTVLDFLMEAGKINKGPTGQLVWKT